MDNTSVPTHKKLHVFISQFGKEGKVPEAILQEEILEKHKQREVAVTQE